MDDNILPLLSGCLANDNPSWNSLLLSCSSIATSLHRHRYTSLSIEDSENIISNIYSKLFDGGLKTFKGETKYELLSYFKTITKNETISYIRANLKRNKDTSLDQDDNQDDSSLYDFLEDNSLRPDMISEINDLYKRAMEQLSIRDQQILMFKVEGYKDKEIAEMLKIPMNTVASSYSRIKDTLLRTLLTIIIIFLMGRNWPWKTSL
ncbi:MAG: sigma-70 family RNA polymerase sigma factor [Desulfuromonadales bacterium]